MRALGAHRLTLPRPVPTRTHDSHDCSFQGRCLQRRHRCKRGSLSRSSERRRADRPDLIPLPRMVFAGPAEVRSRAERLLQLALALQVSVLRLVLTFFSLLSAPSAHSLWPCTYACPTSLWQRHRKQGRQARKALCRRRHQGELLLWMSSDVTSSVRVRRDIASRLGIVLTLAPPIVPLTSLPSVSSILLPLPPLSDQCRHAGL